MALSALAESIYQILRSRVPGEDPKIFYSDLLDKLRSLTPPNRNLKMSDLFPALGELGHACRAAGLPVLSSIVIAKDSGVPGPRYYTDHHPQARSKDEKSAAWQSEFDSAKTTTYPPTLG